MKAARAVIGLLGAAVVAVGVGYLLDDALDDLVDTAKWLIGGVVVHDGLLAIVVVVIGVVAARTLPAWARSPVAVGFIVLGTVTVSAIPVLGRFGARSDNATLLDRDYIAGWLVLAALTVVAVAAGCVWNRRLQRSPVGIPADRRPRERRPGPTVRKA